jgi:hypothetical protein
LPKKTSLAARASQTCPNLEELRSNCTHLGINYSITNLKSGYIMLYWSIIIGIIILTNHHSSEVAVRSLQFIWVNYNISLTWIKAIWGWFPLLTMIPVRSQWGRYNLPIYIYICQYDLVHIDIYGFWWSIAYTICLVSFALPVFPK